MKKWREGSLTGGNSTTDPEVRVEVVDGKLNITPRIGITKRSYNGWVTRSSWDMTAAHARVGVSETTTGTADTIFAVGTDADNWCGFVLEGGKLYLQLKVNGKKNSTNISYSALRHRYWRLRHEATLDQMLWETSGDGNTWVIVRQMATPIPLTNCYIYMGAGSYQSETNPGTAVFDSFRFVVHTEQ
jgi:hypothetical protein